MKGRVTTITFQGKTMTLKKWASELGVSSAVLHRRMAKGWPAEKVLVPTLRKQFIRITFDGMTLTVRQWSRKLGIPEMTLYSRLRKKLPLDKVFLQGKMMVERQATNTKNYAGQTINHIRVLRKTDLRTRRGLVIWEAECLYGALDCKGRFLISSEALRKKQTHPCGCKHRQNTRQRNMQRLSYAGQIINHIRVIRKTDLRTRTGGVIWEAECLYGALGCKGRFLIQTAALCGGQESCGCKARQDITKRTLERLMGS